MDYKVTDTQLKAIADKIREKAGIDDPGGKNLLKPGETTVAVEAGKKYYISADITWDGIESSFASVLIKDANGMMLNIWSDARSDTPASGRQERYYSMGTAPNGAATMTVTINSKLSPTNIMIEEAATGQTGPTEYEAYYPRKLEFPDDFIDAIDSIETATET